jgi:hypothetical protein
MATLSNEFEAELDAAHSSLSSAGERYEEISQTDTVPEQFIQGIRELEDQLDELGRTTTVTEGELALASQTHNRAALLDEAFVAFRERQRLFVEQTVTRLEYWNSPIEEISLNHSPTSGLISDVSHRIGILRQLVDAGQHAQVTTNPRVTPSGVERDLRELDEDLREMVSPETYVDLSGKVVAALLDRAHDVLKRLDAENPHRTAFRDDLQTVKEFRSATRDALEAGNEAVAVESIRTALEAALMTDYRLAQVEADQQLAVALGNYLTEHGFETPDAVEPLVSSGDVSALVERITTAVGSEVQLTVEERVRHLLDESDGSVRRTVERANLDQATVLEHVMNMYTDETISDLRVEFNR